MSSVILTCNVAADDGLSFTVDSYQWNTAGCYTHPNRNGGSPSCFPDGETVQSVTATDVTAEDVGAITCTVTISGSDYTSGSGSGSGSGYYTSGLFTLRISGE